MIPVLGEARDLLVPLDGAAVLAQVVVHPPQRQKSELPRIGEVELRRRDGEDPLEGLNRLGRVQPPFGVVGRGEAGVGQGDPEHVPGAGVELARRGHRLEEESSVVEERLAVRDAADEVVDPREHLG